PAPPSVPCAPAGGLVQRERPGSRSLPVERGVRVTATCHALTPWQLLEALAAVALGGHDWRTHKLFLTQVARASRRLYLKYGVLDRMVELYVDPALSDDGDLTDTR